MRIAGLAAAVLIAAVASIGGCLEAADDSIVGTVIAQGNMTLPPGPVNVVTVEITQPGTLRATFSWTGDPTEMEAAFRHIASGDVHGLTTSPTPLTATAPVTSTDVAAGTQWLLVAGSPASSAVSVQYTVTFEPQ